MASLPVTQLEVHTGNTSTSRREVVQEIPQKISRPVDQGKHAYIGPLPGDLRSVCPALNTLANHRYIPHDGRNVTFKALANALHTAYGISPGFAKFLVLGSYILLRRDPLRPLDLHEIGKHDRIEHNASVVHDDAGGNPYAPPQVDVDLLQKFLNKAYTPPEVRAREGDGITYEDIAYTRVAREAVSGHIDAIHQEIARGEFAMILNIFGKGADKVVSRKDMECWLTDNRFPPGWGPSHEETFDDTRARSTNIRLLVNAYRGTLPEKHHGPWTDIGEALKELLAKAEAMGFSSELPDIVMDERAQTMEHSSELPNVLVMDEKAGGVKPLRLATLEVKWLFSFWVFIFLLSIISAVVPFLKSL